MWGATAWDVWHRGDYCMNPTSLASLGTVGRYVALPGIEKATGLTSVLLDFSLSTAHHHRTATALLPRHTTGVHVGSLGKSW